MRINEFTTRGKERSRDEVKVQNSLHMYLKVTIINEYQI